MTRAKAQRRKEKEGVRRVFLSPPQMGGEELEFIKEAFESNYIAPLGPQVDAFEREFAEYVGIKHCLALSSGTAAIHLALKYLGVERGDEVFASTLTFIGSVTPITFLGAKPVFIDCDRTSWNMDPELLEEELELCSKRGKLPKAVVPTDLYGQCCDLGRIVEICDRYGVPVICDSAEAMGAKYKLATDTHRQTQTDIDFSPANPSTICRSNGAGSAGEKVSSHTRTDNLTKYSHAGVGAKAAVYSFNGNKIITTSGGGMLASDDEELIEKAKYLSQQARDPLPHYEHFEIGFNYRMSNVLAAIGRGQLRVLDERVKRKREIFEYYKDALGDLAGIEFMPEPAWSQSNRWLTVVLITPGKFGADREQIRLALEEENIESRPVWKPMHLQPVFQVEAHRAGSKAPRYDLPDLRGKHGGKKRCKARKVGGDVAEDLFERGLCLPSGTAMSNSDLDRIIETILRCRKP